ncbi:hypothetical protein TNCV_5058041 [Trichonephila clavipes]|nr:hypothetical protein TNCV_5058041 [Trichonephila clavipes]
MLVGLKRETHLIHKSSRRNRRGLSVIGGRKSVRMKCREGNPQQREQHHTKDFFVNPFRALSGKPMIYKYFFVKE